MCRLHVVVSCGKPTDVFLTAKYVLEFVTNPVFFRVCCRRGFEIHQWIYKSNALPVV
jgi:hypothetical protein